MTVDEKAFEAACEAWKEAGNLWLTYKEKMLRTIEAYEAAKAPASLADCSRELTRALMSDPLKDGDYDSYRATKAVLSAAGMKYE